MVDSRVALLRERRDVLLDALSEYAPAWGVRRPNGGLSAWVRLPSPVATRLASAAAREGLIVTPGPAFSVDGTFERHLRLPFTAAPEVRAARRSAEITTQDATAVADALHRREAADAKVVDFLTAAPGVTVVDSTALNFDETVDAVLDVVRAETGAHHER